MHATQFEPGPTQPLGASHARTVLVLRTQLERPRRIAWIAAGVVLVAAALIAVALMSWGGRPPLFQAGEAKTGPVERLVMPTKSPDLSIILDTDVLPMTPDDARSLNELRPLDVAAVSPAQPFRVAAGATAQGQFDAALKCLAQAIYFEAASEPEAGQRAVAQVVLNRVKHPAFPNTICGVVYQGSERVTGCQFTFACDGSLARVPLPSLYRRAEGFARQAMAGRVAPEVGNSTNYHADYVVPYWASSLDKLAQIGRHIFYGLRGAIGYRSAFRMRYDVALETPPGPAVAVIARDEIVTLPDPLLTLPGALPSTRESRLSEDVTSGSLIPGSASPAIEAAAPSALRADQDRGQLVEPGSRPEGPERAAKPPAIEPG